MIPPSQNAYLTAYGAGNIPNYTFPDPPRDPGSNDTQYAIYTRWVNTLTGSIWYLESFSIVSAVVQATWRAVAPIVISENTPTASDYRHPIGQTWVVPSSTDYWVLVNVVGTVATWSLLSTSPTPAAFSAFLNATLPTVTGNGAVFTFGDVTPLTEIFDNGSDFNPTGGVFTAPLTGIYRFSFALLVESLTVAMTAGNTFLSTTLRSYDSNFINIGAVRNASNQYSVSGTFLVDMTATDTAILQIQISGAVGDTAGIVGHATTIFSSFSGELVV